MNVLLVLDVFSHLGGGVSSVVFKLANSLAERGNKVTIFASDDKRDDNYLSDLNPLVQVKYFKTLLKIGGMNFAPGVILSALLGLRKFDVIHFHSFTSFINIPLFYFARKYSIPTILDCHGNLPSTDMKGRKFLFHKLFGRRMFNTSSIFIAETELGKTEYVALGAPADSVLVQHPGFDVLDYEKLPDKVTFT